MRHAWQALGRPVVALACALVGMLWLTTLTWSQTGNFPPASGGSAFPVTVTGGVSGAVPCFTSTTTESAGTLLANNAIVQGGGAGVCPGTGNGDFTIDATAHTLLSGASGLVDFSAITGSSGFKVPAQAGCTASANGAICYDTTNGNLRAKISALGGAFIAGSQTIPIQNSVLKSGNSATYIVTASSITDNGTTVTTTEPVNATAYQSATICKANGTAANPSVASCGSSAAGMFSCATNASTGTCQVNTTAVTANSSISITQNAADGGASQLNVTCNTASDLPSAAPILASKVGGTSFTLNMGTITTNPACFEYIIVN